MDETRREIVQRLALLAATSALSTLPSPGFSATGATSQPEPAVAGALSLQLQFDGGRSFAFDETKGEISIANTGTEIAQSWKITRNAALPLFTVIFVRDLSGGRVEAWLHLGAETVTNAAVNSRSVTAPRLGAYRATLFNGTKVLYAARVPHHASNRAWRLCAGPRPLINNHSALKSGGLVPAIDATATNGTAPATAVFRYDPMGLAGIAKYMPGTGGRDDIGPITEHQAQWLATGNSAAYGHMMAQAEACGTVPWVIVDASTLMAIDVLANPRANTNWPGPRDGTPWFGVDPGPDEIVQDYAHHPNLWFVPYLATKDPYYLWLGQAQTVTAIMSDNPGYKKRPGDVGKQQTREVAWVLRDVLYATITAPQNPTGGFRSRAWFERVLENNRLTIEDMTLRSAHPQAKALHVGPVLNYAGTNNNGVAPWQQDMLTLIVGRIAKYDAKWKPLHDWLLRFALLRTDPASGWDRRFPAVYALPFASNPKTAAEAFSAAKSYLNLPSSIPTPVWMDPNNGPEYTFILRAVLVEAGRMGNAQAAAQGAWLTQALKNSRAKSDYKWAV